MKVIFTIEGVENLDSYVKEFIEMAKKELEESSKKLIAKITGVSKTLKETKFEYISGSKKLIVSIPIKRNPISESYVEIMRENLENFINLKCGKIPLIEYSIED